MSHEEHVHDPGGCETCAKLKKVWMSWGFNEALQMLGDYYEKTLVPETQKVWNSLPSNVRAPEVGRLFRKASDKAMEELQKDKK